MDLSATHHSTVKVDGLTGSITGDPSNLLVRADIDLGPSKVGQGRIWRPLTYERSINAF